MKDNDVELIDRAAAYGDGLFETIAIRGDKPRLWSLHHERLQIGCARLGLPCPDADVLLEKLTAAIGAAGFATKFATARLTVCAANSARGYRRLPSAAPIVQISIHMSSALPAEKYQHGVSTRLCSMRLGVQPLLAGMKTLNRLEQVLARAEWGDDEFYEGLMLDTDGRLICGTMSNVFIIKESAVITPAITRCGVAGVMRRHLVQLLLEKEGMACEVRDVSREELAAADEVFLSNSQFGVLPVHHCDSMQWGVGPVTRRVQVSVSDNGVPECSP